MNNLNYSDFDESLNHLYNEALKYSSVFKKTETLAYIFKKDGKELFISNLLSYFFDCTRCGDSAILKCLLKLIDLKELSYFDDLQVEREHYFKNRNKYIDIVITFGNYVIGIENKLMSDLSREQLQKYSRYLDDDYEGKEIYKILLYPTSNKSANLSNTISKKDLQFGFIPITYDDFVTNLKEVYIDSIDNTRLAFLLNDFIKYMEENYTMKKQTVEENLNLLFSSNDNKDRFIKINEFYSNSSDIFIKYLENKITQSLGENWDINPQQNAQYFQIYKTSDDGWPKNKNVIHFEILYNDKSKTFPYCSYSICLHIHECKSKINKADYNLFKKIKNDFENYVKKCNHDSLEFKITYNKNEFETSIDNMIKILKDSIKKYEKKLDDLIKKARISN